MIILKTIGTASIEIEDVILPAIAADGRQPANLIQSHTTPAAPLRFALLLYLAAENGRPASREQLASLVFPDRTASAGAHSLRELIYQFRRAGAPIVASGGGYMIESRFVRADYDEALSAPTFDDETLNAMLGGFLPTFTAPWSEAYTEWLDAWRAARIGALTRRTVVQIEEATHAGNWDAAERAARACLGMDPWNEMATFSLAEGLAVGGSKAAAFQLLDRYIAEVAPQSADLAARASRRRRRISDGASTAVLRGTGSGAIGDTGESASPRLVGRAGELGALIAAFDRAKAGESQCFVVTGEAGIGKTRLVADFSAAARLRKAHVERVTIQPHDGDRPMGAFVDLVPGLLEANGALGCSEASMAALRNLIGQRAADDASPQTAGSDEHEQRWSAVSRAVVDLCEAIGSEQTLVVVIEDAHWLDALSANTIGRIVGTKRKARILVVATTRDPRPLVREIRLTERCRTISLGQLTAAASSELLDIVLPIQDRRVREDWIGESLQSLKDRITSISAGNPLFLISLAAHSRAHRGPFEVPGTIVETFAQRIDALSHRAMTLLATCAQLGKHSTVKRLVRAMEMRKHAFVEALLELTDSGLVLRDAQAANLTHPLVSEALRTRLHEVARRAVAHAVAGTLEKEAESGQSPALWWDVAESWRVADNPEKAINALKRCAQHALEIGRPGEAARILYEAAGLEQPLESLVDVSESLMRAGNAANDFALVLQAAAVRRRIVQVQYHDDLEFAENRALLRNDLSPDAVERLLNCASSRDASASHRIEAAIALLKGSDTLGSGVLREQVSAVISESDLFEVPLFLRLEFRLLAAVVAADWRQVIETARDILRECKERPETANSRYLQNAGIALLYAGQCAESIAALKRAYELALEMGSTYAQLTATVMIAGILIETGPPAEHEAWYTKCALLVQDDPHLAMDFDYVLNRALTALHSDHPSLAARAVREADARGLFASPMRARWKRVLDLAIRVMRSAPTAPDEAVARAIAGERLITLNGVRELEVGVACQVLAERGHKADATRVILEYLTNDRRALAPLSPSVLRAMRSLDLDVPPSGVVTFVAQPHQTGQNRTRRRSSRPRVADNTTPVSAPSPE